MELRDMYPAVLIIITIGLVLGIGLYVLALFGESAFTEIKTNTTSEAILRNNGTTFTLEQTPNSGTFNGTIFNTTWLVFSGASDKVTMTTINISSPTNLSYSFWINTGQSNSTARVILNINESDSASIDKVVLIDGLISWEIQNDSADNHTINSSYINDSAWHNVVLNYDNISEADGNASIFVDGVFTNETLVGMKGAFNSTLVIGKDFNNFTGYIDEVRIYNETLTIAEIAEVYNANRVLNSSLPTKDLIFWLAINENSGTTLYYFGRDNVSVIESSAISGATWDTDGITSDLTNGTDYSLGVNIITILNKDLSWNQVNATYNYDFTEVQFTEGYNANIKVTSGLGDFADWIAIIVVVIAAAIILGLVMKSFGKQGNV